VQGAPVCCLARHNDERVDYCEGEAGKEKVRQTFSPPNGRTGMYALDRMAEQGLRSPSV